jgi:hypothetical protein
MKRCFGWSLLLMVGILLGMAISPLQVTHADPSDDDSQATDTAKSDANANMLSEMRQIKGQLKEINAYLRTGVVKVHVLMNPDQPAS